VVSAPSVLHVGGSLRDALTLEALARLTTEDIVRFLADRRWFAAKAGTPRAARIASVVPLPWDDGSFAIARLDVETHWLDCGHTIQEECPHELAALIQTFVSRLDDPGRAPSR
jgi:hypothetical protein